MVSKLKKLRLLLTAEHCRGLLIIIAYIGVPIQLLL